jgi:hypothetical protein
MAMRLLLKGQTEDKSKGLFDLAALLKDQTGEDFEEI